MINLSFISLNNAMVQVVLVVLTITLFLASILLIIAGKRIRQSSLDAEAGHEILPPFSRPYSKNRNSLLHMCKVKRSRLSPEIHSARKFALVNFHLRSVIKENRHLVLPSSSNQK